MATVYSRRRKNGLRWTARVRIDGAEHSKTFNTKAAAQGWARAQEGRIEEGTYSPPRASAVPLFADLIDDFLEHRKRIRRVPGKSFAGGLKRLRDEHGLEPA